MIKWMNDFLLLLIYKKYNKLNILLIDKIWISFFSIQSLSNYLKLLNDLKKIEKIKIKYLEALSINLHIFELFLKSSPFSIWRKNQQPPISCLISSTLLDISNQGFELFKGLFYLICHCIFISIFTSNLTNFKPYIRFSSIFLWFQERPIEPVADRYR